MSRPDATDPEGKNDPYLWLEEVEGEAPLDWVRARNAESLARLEEDPRFEAILKDATALYTATDRIPYGVFAGGSIYNFWQDETHVRGLIRRTSPESYRQSEPDWETVLDIDALSELEGESWVYSGRSNLPPDYKHSMIRLSRGGGDAVLLREFDLQEKRFVEDGFTLPEGKQTAAWLDADTLIVTTAHGGGTTNDSGYARQVRAWNRGTPIDAAPLIFEGRQDDAFTNGYVAHRPEGAQVFVLTAPDFFHQEVHHVSPDLGTTRLPLPDDVDFCGMFQGHVLVTLRSEWRADADTFPAGAVVSIPLGELIEQGSTHSARTVFAPDERSAVLGIGTTRSAVYVNVIDNVTGRLIAARPDGDAPVDRSWACEDVPLPSNGTLIVTSADSFSDALMVNFESFLAPSTLYQMDGDPSDGGARDDVTLDAIKSLPQRIDPAPYETGQHFATSADGTRVPYFLVRPKSAAGAGPRPTLLNGYGGFEVSLTPSYVRAISKTWLEHGGAVAVANIRGGGEFGPAWHQAALKANRQRAYDDFTAVAEHLIETGVTEPAQLGIHGGSNGGLLVGVAFTQRPDLYGAVACSVPLLDMLRYHKLPAGASWIGEYGDPEIPEERATIAAYSPYQALDPAATYPEVFITTSTKDDRVHPGHARKMVARMQEQGHPVLYFENVEGGHAAAADLVQMARRDALSVIYFLQQLVDPPTI